MYLSNGEKSFVKIYLGGSNHETKTFLLTCLSESLTAIELNILTVKMTLLSVYYTK